MESEKEEILSLTLYELIERIVEMIIPMSGETPTKIEIKIELGEPE